jgi:hypothetical protein
MDLKRRLGTLKIEEEQLKYCWQNSWARESHEMLRAAGLIHLYGLVNLLQDLCSTLIRDFNSDCRSLKCQPTDTLSLRGFQLKTHWDCPQFGWIVAIALLFFLGVGGVSTGASKNWQTGLAAAGLVATMESFLVGLLAIYDRFGHPEPWRL